MNAQIYIQEQLNKLKTPSEKGFLNDATSLKQEIFRAVFSKKFRKYSASEELRQHCQNAIALQVAKNQPINITFVHGAYKLWRLEESPEADWAELFALMYYTRWAKGICDIYEPGVHFDFFVDDYIVPELDNIPMEEVEAYLTSYQGIIDFLKSYQPQNLSMTVTTVGSQFASREEFQRLLNDSVEAIQAESKGVLATLTPAQQSMVEMNVKLKEGQDEDPLWREKIWQLHNAYLRIKKATGYHLTPEKILAFTQPLASGTTISVGTTKSSVAKFWCGIGALKKRGESFQEIILSPSNIEKQQITWEKVTLPNLIGKNFTKIRVVEEFVEILNS